MLPVAPPVPVTELSRLFAYDPDTGDLRWRVARPPRIKAGDIAGSVHPDGYRLVTLNGRKVYAHHIAYALYHGEWPQYRLGMVGALATKDPDARKASRSDLRIANIESQESLWVQTTAAERQRMYNANAREMKRGRKALENLRDTSIFPNVYFSTGSMQWVVVNPYETGPAPKRQKNDPPDMVYAPTEKWLGRYSTKEEAEQVAAEYEANRTSLETYPEHETQSGDDLLRAGYGETFEFLNKALCYDPERGVLVWRRDPFRVAATQGVWWRAGLTAHKINTNGRPVVTYNGHQYPAHLLAWFLTHREWPTKKAIGFANNNSADYRLVNLTDSRRPDPNGNRRAALPLDMWQPHHGRTVPAIPHTFNAEVRMRNADTFIDDPQTIDWYWDQSDPELDVIAYRLLPKPPPKYVTPTKRRSRK